MDQNLGIAVPSRQKYDPKKQYPKYPWTYKQGGINMAYEKNNIDADTIKNIAKQVGQKLVSGQIKNIMDIQKPIKLLSDVSFLKFIAYDNAPTQFLDYAAAQLDPVERLKYVCCFKIASFGYTPSKIYTKAPYDPVLGETAQLQNETGATFEGESFEYRSPSCFVNMRGKNDIWNLSYFHKAKAVLVLPKLNDIEGQGDRSKVVKFKDGGEIVIDTNLVHISGILYGDRTIRIQKTLRMMDKKNNLQLVCTFNYTRERTYQKVGKALAGFFSKKSGTEQSVDYFDIKIYKYDGNFKSQLQKDFDCRFELSPQEQLEDNPVRTVVSEGFGNYTSFCQFDGEVYWQCTDKIPEWQTIQNDKILLQSDFSRREDIQLLAMKNLEIAEKVKNKIEDQDAKDQNLRYKK